MSRRQSKRDLTIASASLLVYPVVHAYDEFLSLCNKREELNRTSEVISSWDQPQKRITIGIPCGDGKFSIKYHQTSPTAGVFVGSWEANDWEVGFPCKSHRCEHRMNWKGELVTAYQWQSNFAKCALEIHKVRSAFYVLTAVRKMLLSKNLLFNVAWAKAIADVLSKSNPQTGNPLNNLGLLYSTQWWNLTCNGMLPTSIDIGAIERIRQLAKNFPATQPSDIYPTISDRERIEREQFALSALDVE